MASAIPLFGTVSSTSVFYGFILPWVFAYAIFFGLLTGWGKFNKTTNMALSFVIAFFVTGVGGPALAEFFITIFGGAAFILAGILVIILFMSMLGYTDYKAKWAAGVVILIGIILFFVSSGSVFNAAVFVDSQTASAVFWIIVIILAAYLISREGAAAAPKPAAEAAK